MSAWDDNRILDLFGIDMPIVLAPMAGAGGAPLAIAVAQAGGLGSLPCAMLSVDDAHAAVALFRESTARPVTLNFFCHTRTIDDTRATSAWRAQLHHYFDELGLDADNTPQPVPPIRAFDVQYCELIEEVRPAVVSFHFGLPDASLTARVHAAGAKIIASATTVTEARWLAARGCDAIIAQGAEAGGHRGSFLAPSAVAQQVGTFALVPQIVDAVDVPVIAAGGVGDARGIAAALALGASGVQMGTAYLSCPESTLSPSYRQALKTVRDDATALTNVLTGRPARAIVNRVVAELGAIAEHAPGFPDAAAALAVLRSKAESLGSSDFSSFWAGQAAPLAHALPAGEVTRRLAAEALRRIGCGAA
ncbi:nitronate monooxygenase family protein [Paraburkholderia sp. C35]|uniref:NAD(P)H-dependent flavin oxidoreductase n=1 Tax=Paraburkholderia sp. C35 TaxID=2126993 RepID=UPI000D68D072|nr:nitronate monooxygenase family protein [Paraburkholderia sp. C35]